MRIAWFCCHGKSHLKWTLWALCQGGCSKCSIYDEQYQRVYLCTCRACDVCVERQAVWSEVIMQQPWSSLRSFDFHCFKSAVRHFCFAHSSTFSPSHSVPRKLCRFVSRQHHITYSLLLCSIRQMSCIPPSLVAWSVFFFIRKHDTQHWLLEFHHYFINIKGKAQLSTNSQRGHVLERVCGPLASLFSTLPASVNEAERLVPAGCTSQSTAVHWDPWALDYAWQTQGPCLTGGCVNGCEQTRLHDTEQESLSYWCNKTQYLLFFKNRTAHNQMSWHGRYSKNKSIQRSAMSLKINITV